MIMKLLVTWLTSENQDTCDVQVNSLNNHFYGHGRQLTNTHADTPTPVTLRVACLTRETPLQVP